MPTYEYRCKDCQHELEAQQSFHDEPLTECPSCGGTLKKRFPKVGISFKGSGFYKNDSRSSNGSGTGSTSSSTTSSTTSSSSESSAPSSDSASSSSGSSGSSSSSGGAKTEAVA